MYGNEEVSAYNVKVSACNVKVSACNVEVPACNVKVSAYNVEVSACTVKVSACTVEVSSYNEDHPYKAVEGLHNFRFYMHFMHLIKPVFTAKTIISYRYRNSYIFSNNCNWVFVPFKLGLQHLTLL